VTAARARRSWSGLHCHLHWTPPDVDAFLVDTIAPALDRLRAEGRIGDWFFIRYAEGGPHLRLRVGDAAPGVAAELATELARLVAQAPPPPAAPPPADESTVGGDRHRHGTVVEVGYRPETGRYGGADAIVEAEEVFCRSTDVALRILATPRSPRARLAVATDLIIATALALDLDRLETGRWLRAYAAGWGRQADVVLLPAVIGEVRTNAVLAGQTPALQQRWAKVEELVSVAGGPGRPADPVAGWAATVRRARARLEPAVPENAAGNWPAVWASQLHMLLNRIGVAPDEERSLCRLVAATAVLPNGIVPFFDDGVDAADRRYHEASKYLPGRLDDQRPRDVGHPRPAWSPRPGSAVALPRADHDLGALSDALRGRRSGRGRLTGPLTATELGTLLWHACGSTTIAAGPSFVRLAYPSAGRQYAARLHLVARDVAGLAAGAYEVDPFEQALHRTGPAPSSDDLEATSMWFGAAAAAAGGVDLGAVPALLGLSVRVSGLRSRYGLRSLRFALLEAGHLAQNLALVAAATGLELGMIGGFYDDLASGVFGLDGIDRFIVYLLPVGRIP
jgi:thiopeptide-type bacteriocin biosynthesis protein